MPPRPSSPRISYPATVGRSAAMAGAAGAPGARVMEAACQPAKGGPGTVLAPGCGPASAGNVPSPPRAREGAEAFRSSAVLASGNPASGIIHLGVDGGAAPEERGRARG